MAISSSKQWKQTLEIVPGASIGPFELGMTRDEILALEVRPMRVLDGGSVHFPLHATPGWRESHATGVLASFDETDICNKIEARFERVDPSVEFTLAGQPVNSATPGEFAALLGSITSDIQGGYGSIESPSAGVRAIKWEASDDFFVAVVVEPKVGVAAEPEVPIVAEAERDWEPLPDGVEWTNEMLMNVPFTRERLTARFGEPIGVDLDTNGIGLFDGWALRFSCGLEVVLWWLHMGNEAARRDAKPTGVSVFANQRDPFHVAFHLGVDMKPTGDDRARIESREDPDEYWHIDWDEVDYTRRWRVNRQDDNGNVSEVVTVTSECEARAIALAMEARGHKQMYEVQTLPVDPEPEPSAELREIAQAMVENMKANRADPDFERARMEREAMLADKALREHGLHPLVPAWRQLPARWRQSWRRWRRKQS